jgi:hypothetical protein
LLFNFFGVIFQIFSMRVPAAVTEAIENFVPAQGFIIVRPSRKEQSVIFKWGVRVRHVTDDRHYAFICLASDQCRRKCELLHLSNKKTSRATKHLKKCHHIFSVSVELHITLKMLTFLLYGMCSKKQKKKQRRNCRSKRR